MHARTNGRTKVSEPIKQHGGNALSACRTVTSNNFGSVGLQTGNFQNSRIVAFRTIGILWTPLAFTKTPIFASADEMPADIGQAIFLEHDETS
jgi:hypothetical protein